MQPKGRSLRFVPGRLVDFALVGLAVGTVGLSEGVVATGAGATTTSHYEFGADPASLFQQGATAGNAGQQGLVILDFGRPAVDGNTDGVIDHADTFISLADIEQGTESYLRGYLLHAPPDTWIEVAIGTNNSWAPASPVAR